MTTSVDLRRALVQVCLDATLRFETRRQASFWFPLPVEYPPYGIDVVTPVPCSKPYFEFHEVSLPWATLRY